MSSLEGQPSPKRPWSRRKRMLAAFAIIMAIVIPVFGFLAWDYSTCPSATIVPVGTLTVSQGQHLDYILTVNRVIWGPNRPITLTLTSDNAVTMYVMTLNQFTSFNTTNTASSYVWNSGQVTSANYQGCSKTCPPNMPGAPVGTDYFIFYDPSSTVTSKVTISQPVVLQSC